jgi:hypothetical protein
MPLNCQPAVFVESERARYAMAVAAADNRICDLYLIANPDKLHLLGGVVAQRPPAPTPVSGSVARA